VAALDLALVLEALTRLDLELVRLQRHANGVETSHSPWSAMAPLHEILRRVSLAMRELRERVLDSATPSTALELREAAFQARIVVTTLQLAQLQATESTVPREFWTTTRHFSRVVDVAVALNRELGRVNAEYIAEKKKLAHSSDSSHHAAVDLVERAERAVDAIGDEPSLACFLAAGASVSAEQFRSSCRMIATLLGVPLAPQRGLFALHETKRGPMSGSPEGDCDV
jgi:hypothetical protein